MSSCWSDKTNSVCRAMRVLPALSHGADQGFKPHPLIFLPRPASFFAGFCCHRLLHTILKFLNLKYSMPVGPPLPALTFKRDGATF